MIPDAAGEDVAARRRGNALTDGPITRTLLLFSLPVLGGNLLQSLNGSINQFWVSRLLGISAITAIGNAHIVLMLMVGLVFGIAMAANILIAQATGARNDILVKQVAGTSVTFFGLLSLLVAAAGFAACPTILRLLGTPADALGEATIYLQIIFLAVPFLYFFAFVQMAQRGVGDSKTPFWFMGLAVFLDILLNPLLIRGFGPIPAMGIAGSAFANFIAQGVALLCLILFLYRQKSPLALGRGEAHYFWPDRAIWGSLVTRGVPMGLQILVMSGGALVMMGFVNRLGTDTVAAYTAASQVWGYVQMPAMAIGAGVSAMAAQNIGARKWKRLDHIAWAGIATSLAATGLVAALLFVFGEAAFGLFLPPGSPAIDIAVHINSIAIWGFVLFSISFALSAVVRSAGAVYVPLFILIVAILAIRLPFAAILLPTWQGNAIWWSLPVGTVAATLLIITYYLSGSWREAHMLTGSEASADGSAPDAAMTSPSFGRGAGNRDDNPASPSPGESGDTR
jgi:putative MATE family efflux protein